MITDKKLSSHNLFAFQIRGEILRPNSLRHYTGYARPIPKLRASDKGQSGIHEPLGDVGDEWINRARVIRNISKLPLLIDAF